MIAGHWLEKSPFGSRDFYGAAKFCLIEAREEPNADDRIVWLDKFKMWRQLARESRRRGR